MQHVSDTSLIFSAVRSGDAEAIGLLIQRYGNLLHSVATRILGSPDDAQRVARQCAMEIARAPYKLRGEPVVAIHERITRSASQHRSGNGPSPARDPAEEPHWEEIRPFLDPALLRVARRHRLIIILHYFQRHGQEELAEMLQVTQPVVAQRLRRALDSLRRRLVSLGAGCSMGQLMLLLARHGASEAPTGWVEAVADDAQREFVAQPTARRRGWVGLVTGWIIIAGLVAAVGFSYSSMWESAEATATQPVAK
ncbi:MAG: sigma-70 family RNA polymerase sigma factor [Phycisphaerae bacterium]|nr:sigma-70 family RNA polymerase sigma factor [Phycisphaerae bacterium]MDW8262066.1 sigma-70 family RNA polymerase sigma factor [Phycisphaerales bacterium]